MLRVRTSKTLTAAAIGLVLGIVGTLGVQRILRLPLTSNRQQVDLLLRSGPHFLEEFIPGAKVLDVGVQSPSDHIVSYDYDALYDVHLTYRLGNDVKSIVLPFGFIHGTPIIPTQSDFVIADDQAKVVRRLNAR
jgi:hypothetical protein